MHGLQFTTAKNYIMYNYTHCQSYPKKMMVRRYFIDTKKTKGLKYPSKIDNVHQENLIIAISAETP
jgi:hypothetical protein